MNRDDKLVHERAATQRFLDLTTEELESIQQAIWFQQGQIEALMSMAKNRGMFDIARELEAVWHRLDITIPTDIRRR